MTKPTHIIQTVESFDTQEGAKNRYYTVGVAWQKDGFVSCKLHKGISISGNFILGTAKEKSSNDGAESN